MTRIGLISDTHGYLDPTLERHFAQCDEIWHAGDIGSLDVLDGMAGWGKQLRVVYGNIDAPEIRRETVEDLLFSVEDVLVFMTHIGGYPGRYHARVRQILIDQKPQLYVCGHSHILKVIYDKKLDLLHVNPGACGKHGLHQVRTAVRFTIDGNDMREMQVIELGHRGQRSA